MVSIFMNLVIIQMVAQVLDHILIHLEKLMEHQRMKSGT